MRPMPWIFGMGHPKQLTADAPTKSDGVGREGISVLRCSRIVMTPTLGRRVTIAHLGKRKEGELGERMRTAAFWIRWGQTAS